MIDEPRPKRVVIRVEKSKPTPDDVPRSIPPGRKRRLIPAGSLPTVGLALTVLGGSLASFGPLFPWWEQVTDVMHFPTGVKTDGLRTWPGLVALAAGIAVMCVAIYVTWEPRPAGRLAWVAAGAGAIAALASLVALGSGREIVGSDLGVRAQIGIFLTLPGGLLAAVGGYLMTKDGKT